MKFPANQHHVKLRSIIWLDQAVPDTLRRQLQEVDLHNNEKLCINEHEFETYYESGRCVTHKLLTAGRL